MIKKITITSLTSLVLLSQSANSEIKAGPLTLTPGIMFQTNYVGEFTGALTNRSKPTYGVDLNIAHDSGVYIYSAIKKLKNLPDAESIDDYGTFDWESCNSLGFAKKIQSLNVDVSYENCYIDAKTEENTGVYYFRASYDLNKQTSIGAAYAKNSTEGSVADLDEDGTYETKYLKDAYKFFVSHDLGLAKTTLTYGKSDNFTDFYSLSLNKDLFNVNFDLAYWSVNAEGWVNDAAPKFYDRDLLVLSLKKTF